MNINLWQKWFPHKISVEEWIPRLTAYYVQNSRYHAMTAGGDKTTHPHARLLLALIRAGDFYAEVGCGGGAVLQKVAQCARVVGMDLSYLALNQSQQNLAKAIPLICAKGNSIPFRDDIFDGVYSFEVLEHVPDPLKVVQEMIRIVKPGGFVFLSFPHRFSLDLHLNKKLSVRMIEWLLAGARFCLEYRQSQSFRSVMPDLADPPYPDCDMISAVNPFGMCKAIQEAGCRLDFCDSTYMCAHREGAHLPLSFQRNTIRPFVRHFGDHYLIMAHKI